MSGLLGLIETVSVDEDRKIWVLCQPITESAPKDIPKVENIASEYWTSRIITIDDGTTKPLTEWFSIPYKNIQKSLEKNVEGPCLIDYKHMDDKSREQLLTDTSPVFSFKDGSANDRTYRWLNR